MALPASVSTATVTGTFLYPDGSAAEGMVVFTPEVPYLLVAGDDVIILPSSVVVPLDVTGSFTVDLVSTDDTSVNPVNWSYRCCVRIGCGMDFCFSMFAPGGTTTDVADAAPIGSTDGDVIGLGTLIEDPVGSGLYIYL